jgi:phosphate transport system substrate-binding protein
MLCAASRPAARSRGWAAVLALSLGLLAFVRGASAGEPYITGSGCSVSNVGYLTALAREYEQRTGVRVLVRGGGSVQGIEDVRGGAVDFAASCRPKSKGDPADIEFVQVAWDALVFIVHPTNPVGDITAEQARSVNFGRTTNWKDLGGKDSPVKLFISRPRRGLSGLEYSTSELLLGGGSPVLTRDATSLASSAIVEQLVEKTPGGFAVTGYSSAIRRKVKLLKVGGVAPGRETIASDRYPFRRPLFIVAPKGRRPEVSRFIEYALGAEGQRFIGSQGVVTLGDVKR